MRSLSIKERCEGSLGRGLGHGGAGQLPHYLVNGFNEVPEKVNLEIGFAYDCIWN